jgi:hypothetical protein
VEYASEFFNQTLSFSDNTEVMSYLLAKVAAARARRRGAW